MFCLLGNTLGLEGNNEKVEFQYTTFKNYVLYLYYDERRDIQSNIDLRLKEFPRANPKGTPEGEVVYLTVYPESSPNT